MILSTIQCNRNNHHFDFLAFRPPLPFFVLILYVRFNSRRFSRFLASKCYSFHCSLAAASTALTRSEKIKIKCKHYKFYTYFTVLFSTLHAIRYDTIRFDPIQGAPFNFFTMMILIWKLVNCYIFSFHHLSHIFYRFLFLSPNLLEI